MSNFFLFQKEPDLAWPAKKRRLYWAWNLIVTALSGMGVGLVSLLLALGPYSLGLARGYFERPLILLLNLLPVIAFTLLWYGVTRSAQRAFVITSVIVAGLSVGNYYKLMFRDDPLMFGDLLLLKEAGNMAGKYRLFLDWKLALTLFCLIGGYLFLRFLVRGRPAKGLGRWAVLLSGAALLCAMIPALLSSGIYNIHAAYYERLLNRWSATQQYMAHGFVYPFVYSINEAIETPPEGYDKKEAAALLEQYEDADIPQDKKVNVMGIMLEAYNDFTKFGTPELAQDVYQVWHQLEDEGWSGDLVTNIFAGGTVDTERRFLTGYTELKNFRGRTNSYPWYFRSQGYTVNGMHPCFGWFYNRLNVNESLGFEDYWFVENYFSDLTGGSVGMDDVFFPELIKTYEESTASGEPCFTFSVTYQGHGPYDKNVCWWGERGDFVVDDGSHTDEEQYILDNYFGSIADTNRHLKELTDYLREDDKPVVLVLFGDHNPWMGDGNSVYHALGIDLDLSTEAGFYNYYCTRYIIWANDAAKAVLGNDFQGEGPAISPNFLMNELFRLCGWTGPAYMQATQAVMDQISVINSPTGLCVEDGVLTDQPSSQGQELLKELDLLQYYYRKNFRYEDLLQP